MKSSSSLRLATLLICLFIGGSAEAAKIIELKGGKSGQGFAPLADDAGSINIGGDEVTVQGITFSKDPGPAGSVVGGTFKGAKMSAADLGFGDAPNPDDQSLATLMEEFRFVNHGPVDFANEGSFVEYRFTHLKSGADYQLDLFTAADQGPRNTGIQVVGKSTFQDTVKSELHPRIVQYLLKPDSAGNIVVRYGFGGGEGDAGILNAIAITTNAMLQTPSVAFDKKAGTVVVVSSRNTVALQPWSDGVLRVVAGPGASIKAKKSLAVIASPSSVGWKFSEDAKSVRLQGKKLAASVDKVSGLVSFFDAEGQPILQQKAWSFKPTPNPDRDGIKARASFVHAPGERFFGGGVIGDDFRQPSAEIRLQNDYLKMHIPVLYSTRGYGFFWDSPDRSTLKTSPDEVSWETSAGDSADFYVMAGPAADTVIAEYRFLTGAAPLLPKWAYGFWFSKNKFDTQQQILDAADQFRKRSIPVDLLIQDYFYWKPTGAHDDWIGWGSHKFVEDRYPDPKGMIKQLHEQDHLHFMAVIWAKLDTELAHGKELEAAGALLPEHGDWAGKPLRYYDPYNPKARQIYGRQVMDSLLSLGLDGFWMDGAEPEMNLDKFATFDTAAGPASRVMSAFPLMHTKAIYEAQRATSQDKRVVLLPRSAWAGSQRNSVVSWTSDIDQTWKVLAWQIEGLQNYSITGLPYITTDVGGYNPKPEADRELFVRWFQWGTFCPIFRVHGVGRPFPWEYGNEGDAIFKKFDNLRYSLLPYIYSEASRVTFDNGTLLRPLVMDFREDAKAVATWDEFLFGSSILVCPVYQSTREDVGTPAQFADMDGKTGFLTANYLKDGATAAVPRKINPGLEIEDGPAEERQGAHGARLSGTFTPAESGSLALEISEPHQEGFPATATIEGKPVTSSPISGDWQFPLFPFEAKAGVPVHISFEGKMSKPGFRIVKITGPVQREVYLPGKDAWIDFWTGKVSQGGQTLRVDAPLDMIPLYVRAGSILPLSPGLQYAGENPEAPVELRVYAGKDGSYALYEDEGDNYHYEKGARASIPVQWNENTQTLTFGARKGTFSGLKGKRTFRVVWVSPGHGVGENKSDQADAEVVYAGTETSIKRPGGTASR